ncbi:MAG: hypothetical protein U0R50_05790 [Gaiellales bacterium]
MHCDRCDGEVGREFRFCPWCSAPLRTKLVEHFRADPRIEREPVGLRVSRYLTDSRHVRLSIWRDDEAAAAISLDEREAARLAAFLAPLVETPPPLSLRASATALWDQLVALTVRDPDASPRR